MSGGYYKLAQNLHQQLSLLNGYTLTTTNNTTGNFYSFTGNQYVPFPTAISAANFSFGSMYENNRRGQLLEAIDKLRNKLLKEEIDYADFIYDEIGHTLDFMVIEE